LLLFCFLIVVFSGYTQSEQWCGQILESRIEVEGNKGALSSSWVGFGNDKRHFEVALAPSTHEIFSHFDTKSRCLYDLKSAAEEEQESIKASTQNALRSLRWTNVGKRQIVDSVTMVSIDFDQQHHILVRSTDAQGNQIISRSTRPTSLSTRERVEQQEEEEEESRHRRDTQSGGDQCQAANLCRARNAVVGDLLTQLYGEPEWFVPGEFFLSDDDDDGLSDGEIAGIVIGSVGGALLLLLLLLLLLGGGTNSDKFTSTGMAGAVEDDPSNPRGALTTADQNTNVVIEYPSTNLSLDKPVDVGDADVGDAANDGVRPQLTGALDTQTPSGRDYRAHL